MFDIFRCIEWDIDITDMEIGHWVISAICGLWDPWLCFIHVFTANIHHMAAATNILEMMMMVTKTMAKTMVKTKTKTKALCMYSQPISIICRLPRISLRWQGRGWWKPFIVKQQATGGKISSENCEIPDYKTEHPISRRWAWIDENWASVQKIWILSNHHIFLKIFIIIWKRKIWGARRKEKTLVGIFPFFHYKNLVRMMPVMILPVMMMSVKMMRMRNEDDEDAEGDERM